jgi:hypothetical protein
MAGFQPCNAHTSTRVEVKISRQFGDMLSHFTSLMS